MTIHRGVYPLILPAASQTRLNPRSQRILRSQRNPGKDALLIFFRNIKGLPLFSPHNASFYQNSHTPLHYTHHYYPVIYEKDALDALYTG
jgi:hypothetical protein